MTTSAAMPPNVPQTSVEHRYVEGWAQYYEYFHKLNADMQVRLTTCLLAPQPCALALHSLLTSLSLCAWQQTSQASAQRRRCSDAKITLKPTDSACFDAIARCIGASDKHIVRIEGDGSNAQLADGSRTLCEADLALVRAQLRAAAQSSSFNIDPDEQEDILLEAAQDIEVAVLSQLGDSARQTKRSAEPGAGAAAIETLLWFGLALGEAPRSPQQQQMARQLEQQQMEQRMLEEEQWDLPGLEAEPVPSARDLEVLSDEQSFPLSVEFDWEQAAGEVGLDDEVVRTPMPPRPLLAKGSVSQDSLASEVTTCPIERFDSSSSANSEDDSRAMSVYSDFNDCSSEAGASECFQLNDAGPSCGSLASTSLLSTRPCEGVETEGVEMLDDISSSLYSSPRDAASDRRCSRREARPPKQWDSQVEAPLLKWEKEQQQPRGKRRSAVKRHATGSAQGADTYETDGSEDLATQLGIPSQLLEPDGCFMLLADCTPAKRQRNAGQ
jgi:hypothetical protein